MNNFIEINNLKKKFHLSNENELLIFEDLNFSITKNLKNSIVEVLKDVRLFKKDCSIVLFSPAAASFDQFRNFEIRGNKFKKLCKSYAKKNI